MSHRLVPLLLVVGALVASLVAAQTNDGVRTFEDDAGVVVGAIDWSASGTIQARGFGTGASEATARIVAIADGQRRLLEIVQGVHLVSGVTLGDAEQESDILRTRVRGVLVGARALEDTAVWDPETGSYQITMAVALGEFQNEITPLSIADIDFPVPPLAFADRVGIAAGDAVTLNVLTNDLDRNGDPLSAELVSGPSHGTLTLEANGEVRYQHDGGDADSDSFVYRASDGTSTSEDAAVTILIAASAESGPTTTGPDSAPEAALDLLGQARALLLEALETEPVRSPDQRLWRDLLPLIDEAVALAPSAPETLRARARAYAYVHWHARAWEYWQQYLDSGGALTDPNGLTPFELTSEALFVEAGTGLGLARYRSDQQDEALQIYLAMLEQIPGQPAALREAGRIHIEAGRLEAALPLFAQLAAVQPGDIEVLRVASRIHLETGRLDETLRFVEELALLDANAALELYLALLEQPPEAGELRVQALTGAGRILVEAERLDEAFPLFQQLAELRPEDPEIIAALDNIRDSLIGPDSDATSTPDPANGDIPPPDRAVDQGGNIVAPLPPPSVSVDPRAVEEIGPRTGIILDASHLPIERSFLIDIVDETGRPLRLLAPFFYHSGSLDSARQRPEVADNPEIFEVASIANKGGVVILNDREAQRFLQLLQQQDLIDERNALILGGG